MHMTDCGEHEIDVRALSADFLGSSDDRLQRLHRWLPYMQLAQPGQYLRRARITLRIKRVTEAGQVVAAGTVMIG